MEGICKHKIEFVIVSERPNNYWLPPESVCFESLRRIYPSAFRLVHEEPRFRIFKFVPEYFEAGSAGNFVSKLPTPLLCGPGWRLEVLEEITSQSTK